MKPSERARVVEFLKDHVIGRAVVAAPITTQTDRGRITGAYEEDAIYSNLVEGLNGFAFDLTTLSRGTRYVPGRDGKGLLAEGTLNAVRVIRYEMAERESTHRLVGHARVVASTNSQPDPFAGVIFLVQMTLAQGTLTVHESMMGYADFPGADGTSKAGAVDGTYTYALEKDRLSVRYEQKRFDVDPSTLKRTATADKFPVQVSREVTFPEPDLVAV